MAKGDLVRNHEEVESEAELEIIPETDSGDEYLISNIWSAGEFEVYMSDGTNDVLLETADNEPYALINYKLPSCEDIYLKIVNKSANAVYIGYSGIQTK